MDEGLVKHVGLSEVTTEQIQAAHAIVPITLIELEWSLFSRESEASLRFVWRNASSACRCLAWLQGVSMPRLSRSFSLLPGPCL